MLLSQGDCLGRYEVVAPLGAGGMGEVYRARDTELDREVAVKVLPEEVAGDPKRLERFTREAKAVARLSHPNILEIWDFGTEDGVTYAVTELLEGQTLRRRIPATGLAWQKVVRMGARIADGLGAAHGKGIVHRDLKPENIFITSDGRVKVLDFGLARVQEQGSPDEETHSVTPAGTEAGTILGTVAYMSPEQVTGGEADHRSDIFSLGCVLYEMVSGRRPFQADTEVEVMAAILLEEPPQLSSTGAALPVDLEQTIHRCLEKTPEARFQSAADLAFALRSIGTGSAVPMARPTGEIRRGQTRTRWWLAAAAAAVVATVAAVVWLQRGERESPPTELDLDPRRLVVAAFDNRTGDPSLDTVGVMAADLIVQRFTETGAAEAVPMEGGQAEGGSLVLPFARQRGAALVLSGASYLDGETLRLQARLVDAAIGDLIYAFEPVTAARGEASDAIDVLRERVVAAVAAHVNSPLIDISLVRPPASYEAFQAYERAEEMFGSGNPEAIEHYRRALELDPDFQWGRISLVYGHLMLEERERAEREISTLLELMGRMTPFEQRKVHYLRTWLLDRDLPGALSEVRALVGLAPHMGGLRSDLGCRAMGLNRPAEAIAAFEPVVHSLYPSHYQTDWWPLWYITAACHMLGDYERGLEYANLGLERHPGVANFFWQKARALAALGRIQEVEAVVDEFLRVQTSGWSAGLLMSRTAIELREHGFRKASDEMAARCLEWYESHPSLISEGGWDSQSFGYGLWMVGRWEELEDHVVRLIESEPSDRDLVGWLAVVAAMNGDAGRAKKIVANLPPSDDPDAPAWEMYWKASVAAHLGDKDRAVAILAEAFSKGLQYDQVVLQPEEFEPLWDFPPYQEMMRPKG